MAGTSAGSVVGAAYAAGYCWRGIAELASSAFWPSLLVGARLEQFCSRHLPEDFNELELDFSAVATLLPSRQPVSIREGRLASAINASCALRVVRRSVFREGRRLKDGGIACVLPARVCREMGADVVIASDVWELSSLLVSVGLSPDSPRRVRLYPAHYRSALAATDLLVRPRLPLRGYLPTARGLQRMIAAGEAAANTALEQRWL